MNSDLSSTHYKLPYLANLLIALKEQKLEKKTAEEERACVNEEHHKRYVSKALLGFSYLYDLSNIKEIKEYSAYFDIYIPVISQYTTDNHLVEGFSTLLHQGKIIYHPMIYASHAGITKKNILYYIDAQFVHKKLAPFQPSYFLINEFVKVLHTVQDLGKEKTLDLMLDNIANNTNVRSERVMHFSGGI